MLENLLHSCKNEIFRLACQAEYPKADKAAKAEKTGHAGIREDW